MLNNRTWLAFANRKRCRHTDAVLDSSIGEWEEHVFLLEI